MRIFDCLNDVDNVKSTIKYVKKYGGIADCAVCYTVDPKYPKLSFFDKLRGKKNPELVFTDEYFVEKAKVLAGLGADMITIKDMSGLIPPQRVSALVKKLKAAVSVPVDFHTHCTPGYGLASVYAAIAAGVDVVDTNCWWFGGGTGAPALELVYLFCQKMDIDLGVNMEAVAKINEQLKDIRSELNISVFGADKPAPKPFNPVVDATPAEVEALLDKAVAKVESSDMSREEKNALIDRINMARMYTAWRKLTCRSMYYSGDTEMQNEITSEFFELCEYYGVINYGEHLPITSLKGKYPYL
jgi:pyruvate carboxylase subunit B